MFLDASTSMSKSKKKSLENTRETTVSEKISFFEKLSSSEGYVDGETNAAESLDVYEMDDVIPSSGDEEAVAKFEEEFTKRSALRRSTRKRKLCTKSSNGGSSSKQVGSISADETTQIYKPSSQEMKT